MKKRPGFGFILIVAIGLFGVLNAAAILVYPGGTVMEPRADRFLFWQNFLSDLGRTQTFAKESNQASRWFFVPALLLIATATGLFFRSLLPRLVLKDRQRFAKVFMIAVWVTTLARMGVGLTPWDLVGHLHLFFVQLTFFSGSTLGILLLQEARQEGSIVAAERPWLMLWVIVQGLYLLLLLTGPFLHIESQVSLFVAAGSQKILLFVECWVMLRLGWMLEQKSPGFLRGA